MTKGLIVLATCVSVLNLSSSARAEISAVKGAPITIVVTNVDFSNWIMDGLPDPDITLIRGQDYVFDLQGIPAFHPFFIKTIASTGAGNTYNDGVSANGVTGDTDITFNVPLSAPDALFYSCGNHAAMSGNFIVVDPDQVFINGFE